MSDEILEPLMPKGWIKAGSHPDEYEMGLDDAVRHSGTRSGFIKSVSGELNGFGTLMQMFEAGEFKGKRYRLTGWFKWSGVSGWAGMWMRVDGGDDPAAYLAFDNMQDRPLSGGGGWSMQEIVLDVDEKATRIAFGVLLEGAGKVWVDDFKFEETDKDVPTTDLQTKTNHVNPVATNLNFEDSE